MNDTERQINTQNAIKMVMNLKGLVPLIMIGYDPETTECRLMAHIGLQPVLANREARAKFGQQLLSVLEMAEHPENLQIISESNPAPEPSAPNELERMFGIDEGGEA